MLAMKSRNYYTLALSHLYNQLMLPSSHRLAKSQRLHQVTKDSETTSVAIQRISSENGAESKNPVLKKIVANRLSKKMPDRPLRKTASIRAVARLISGNLLMKPNSHSLGHNAVKRVLLTCISSTYASCQAKR